MSFITAFGMFTSTILLAMALVMAATTLNLSRSIRVGTKNRRIRQVAAYIDVKIDQSNIQSMLPFYNLTFHLMVSLTAATIIYGLTIGEFEKLSVLMVVAAIGFLLPTMGLQLLADYMSYAIRKGSVDMVVALSSAYATEPDIFKAFESIANYAIPPLRSRIRVMLGEYKLKVSPVKCLTRYRASINSEDLQSLIAQMTIKYVEGGNMAPLFMRYLVHVKKISENEENEKVEDFLTNITLYIGILIDFVALHVIMGTEYRGEILGTWWGQTALILNLLMVVVVIVLSLRRH